ncbi:MAG: hypothetical protein H0T46_11250 [Deltaproteobacteria bacterium]|nr:hypothetical protein [Deltaproteobacteria bacterium]
MRNSLAFGFLAIGLLACTSSGGGGGGGDDTQEPDAGVTDPPPPARGFQIKTPEITIMPGQEITYCYYLKTPNTEDMVVKKWSSVMTPGSHHMILFTTGSLGMPEGTVSASQCGIGGASAQSLPAWIYAASQEVAELALPADDGAGKPLGQVITAGKPAYVQMHYVNPSDDPLKVRVTINAEAFEATAAYTPTAPYITFNGSIMIPMNAVGHVETQTCTTPANTRFWQMSTHAHKQAVKTEVKSGPASSTTTVFSSTDWEHPGSQFWMTPTTFHAFDQNKLTFSCTYNNTGLNAGRVIKTGDSAQSDEMCMATGYYFPATSSKICYNGFTL